MLQCNGFSLSAHDWIRTSTPYGTTPSRWHVYQFHHVGKRGCKYNELSIYAVQNTLRIFD